MPTGLKRYQTEGDDHLITFSCYHRLPYLSDDQAKAIFEATLEQIRERHSFCIHGYVVMPEHVHMLLSEPDITRLATALNVLKTQTSKQLKAGRKQFWQTRYHDVNILTHRRWRNVLRYIHQNPVKAGFVKHPEDWPWSSYRHWLTGKSGTVTIQRFWPANDTVVSSDQDTVRAPSMRSFTAHGWDSTEARTATTQVPLTPTSRTGGIPHRPDRHPRTTTQS